VNTIDNRTAEWLEADGCGGFASGTIDGIRTRRYHALLLDATNPPTGRMVLVNGVEAWLETLAGKVALTSQRYAPDVVSLDGAERIESFTGDPWPQWIFRLPGDEEKWPAGKVPLPQSEWSVDRMEKAHYLFVGTESDIRRKMDELIEAANPEYFMWNFDQGFLPMDVMKDQLRQLGEKILPHYR